VTSSPYKDLLSLWLQRYLFNQATFHKSPAHSSTGTWSVLKNLPLIVSLRFHVLFHSPLHKRFQGSLSPFPRGTRSLSVIQEYLALRGGPRRFTRGFTCPMLLGIRSYISLKIIRLGFRLLDFHHLWCRIQLLHLTLVKIFLLVAYPIPNTLA
jgi:hypothetical protein